MKQSIALKTSVLALAATLALAGCNKAPGGDSADNAQLAYALPELPATLPLDSGTAKPIAFAPDASTLPDAGPIRVAKIADPSQAYGFADAAYEYTDALGDAPPDYGFDYDGVEPWAWQGYDNSVAFSEPLDDGYRTYYYRPGETEPYFIRDPYYSYGFAGGLLAAIYAADGGIVPFADYGPRLSYASRYFARGRSLYAASRRGRRLPVYASNWAAQRPILIASRDRWGAGRAHQPAWAAYHNANIGRQQNYWREESVRRQADSRRFGEWQQAGFRTAAPPRAIPVAWSDAKWARDEKRFRPAAGAQQARDESRAALRQQRRDANDTRPGQTRDNAQDRRDDRQQADRAAARQDRLEQRQGNDAGNQQAQQAERQKQRDQAQRQQDRQQAREQAGNQQADRQQADRQQERQQAQQAQQAQRERQQAERQQQRQQAQPGQRPLRENREDRPAARAQAQQAERQQAQAAERQQAQRDRQQAQQAERRQAQDGQRDQGRAAERAQAQAARQQAQQAQRQQAQAAQQQAQQAQRQQAQAAERAQAQAQAQAQRQQAQQAQQQQAAQARQQAQGQAQAERQQAREQRQQNRRDRDQ